MADQDLSADSIERSRSLGPQLVLLDRPRPEPTTWKDAVLTLVGPERPLSEPGPGGLTTNPQKALMGGRFGTDRRLTAEEYRAAETGFAVATGMGNGGLAAIVSAPRPYARCSVPRCSATDLR